MTKPMKKPMTTTERRHVFELQAFTDAVKEQFERYKDLVVADIEAAGESDFYNAYGRMNYRKGSSGSTTLDTKAIASLPEDNPDRILYEGLVAKYPKYNAPKAGSWAVTASNDLKEKAMLMFVSKAFDALGWKKTDKVEENKE